MKAGVGSLSEAQKDRSVHAEMISKMSGGGR